MKWKVITAKKRNEGESTLGGAVGNEIVKKDKHYYANQHNHHQLELSQAEQQKKDDANRHANVDLIWHDVTIPAQKLS